MAKQIIVEHPTTGLRTKGYYGFSWTYFFFGPIVPIVRGDLGFSVKAAILSFFTVGIVHIINAFTYYHHRLHKNTESLGLALCLYLCVSSSITM